ncbi:hypothetical protein [Haloferax sp. ATB1]|uniref:DUF7344 domain-containing protein n=1 Tax=Haloferax sp. ATB1 TaxID=1508454 RepID=UPI0005B1D8C7|nr:hypothetical protein [Haloferax sp. ATB1]
MGRPPRPNTEEATTNGEAAGCTHSHYKKATLLPTGDSDSGTCRLSDGGDADCHRSMTRGENRRQSDHVVELIAVSDTLVNPHRNRVLHVLQRQGTPISLDTLATEVKWASERGADSAEQIPSREKYTRQLHHVHLPKLDSSELIQYDSTDRIVVSLDEERLDHLLNVGQQMLASLEEGRE